MGGTLFIFDLGDGDTDWWRLAHNYRYKPLSHRFAMRFGPQRMRRDVGRIQAALVDSGQAMWLQAEAIDEAARLLNGVGEEMESSAPGAAGPPVAERELQRAAAAVRRLLAAR